MGQRRKASWPRHAHTVARGEVHRPGARFVLQERTRRLEIVSWLLAWRRYALAAAILGQMTFSQSVAHEAVVSEVCLLAWTS